MLARALTKSARCTVIQQTSRPQGKTLGEQIYVILVPLEIQGALRTSFYEDPNNQGGRTKLVGKQIFKAESKRMRRSWENINYASDVIPVPISVYHLQSH